MISKSESLPITIETSGLAMVRLRLSPMSEHSVVPPGLESFLRLFSALKRWAKFGRPSGAAFLCHGLAEHDATTSSALSPQYPCDSTHPRSRSLRTLHTRVGQPFPLPRPAPSTRARVRQQYK